MLSLYLGSIVDDLNFQRWYNTTYALNAAIIILYVVFQGLHNSSDQELLKDVEKSIEIFQAMDDVIVARNCARLIQEVLDIARTVILKRHHQETECENRNDPLLSAPQFSSVANDMTQSGLSYSFSSSQSRPVDNADTAAEGDANMMSAAPDFNPDDLFAMLFDQDLLNAIDFDFSKI